IDLAHVWLERALRALAPLGAGDAVEALATVARASIARGVTPGAARFESALRDHPLPSVTSPFLPSLASAFPSEERLAPRVAALLDWFHPGLAAMVDLRAADPAVRDYRDWARGELCGDG